MPKTLFIFERPAVRHRAQRQRLRLAGSLSKRGDEEVNVFLLGDAPVNMTPVASTQAAANA